MARRGAIYLRVSTQEQTTENQSMQLLEVAHRIGIQIVDTYTDNGISGAKGRDKRPAFDKLLKDATRRKFDIILAWSVDRLGRSLIDLIGFLKEIHSMKIDLYLHQQGLDTTTPAGNAMFQMMGVFAEFERAMIKERTKAGLARARLHGTRSGKSIGRQPLNPKLQEAIRESLAKGISYRKTAMKLDVALSTVIKFSGRGKAEA